MVVGSIAIIKEIAKCYRPPLYGFGGEGKVGGFVGLQSLSSSITNSYSTGNVSGFNYLGGFAGSVSTTSTIADSYSRGRIIIMANNSRISDLDVSIGGFAGGMVAVYSTGNLIERCYTASSFAGISSSGELGGFLGRLTEGNITNSFFDATIVGILFPGSSAIGFGGSNGVHDGIEDLETSDMKADSDDSDDIKGLGSAFEYNQGKYPRVRLKDSTELVPGQEDLP